MDNPPILPFLSSNYRKKNNKKKEKQPKDSQNSTRQTTTKQIERALKSSVIMSDGARGEEKAFSWAT